MQGMILYEGSSVIDGSPIVVIATGLSTGTVNSKTGPMVQVYILRSDIDPMSAVQRGDDYAICGNCRHRGRVVGNPGARRNIERSCYVVLMHGPSNVYKAYRNGKYSFVPLGRARRILKGMRVRIGAYGDPAAVPFHVLEQALDATSEITGYTHSWREYPELSAFCMASCDTPEEREEAKQLGFRTFRVRSKNQIPLDGEGQCPASNEMGKATQCFRCLLCGGHRNGGKADITIIAHGTRARNFELSVAGRAIKESV